MLLDDDQIGKVKDDRIVLKFTEAEAKNLPPVDTEGAAPK